MEAFCRGKKSFGEPYASKLTTALVGLANHKSMRSVVYYQNKVLYITNFAEIVYHQVEAIHAGVMIYTCGDDMHTSCDDIPSLREPPNSYFVLRTPTFGLDKKIPGTSPRIFLAAHHSPYSNEG